MRIHSISLTRADGRCHLSAQVEIETPGKTFPQLDAATAELWIDWPQAYHDPDTATADPFLLMCLPLAMCLGERLELSDPVSQTLALNTLEAVAVYNWYAPNETSVIDLDITAQHHPETTSPRVGSFYSGGVDSLYNIAECERLAQTLGTSPVTDLWLVHGMDIPLWNTDLWDETKVRLQEQLPEDGSMIFADIRTNIRDLYHLIVIWEKLGFSAVLGGISKCFAPTVGTALIGSARTYDQVNVTPTASTPLIDALWSCERQDVRHFSARASRSNKIETIATHTPQLLAGLRVCYLNPKGSYNCGACEKCLRTQMALKLCRVGDFSTAGQFDTPLSVQSLNQLKLPWEAHNAPVWTFWKDISRSCRTRGMNDYARAINAAIWKNRIRLLPLRTAEPAYRYMRKRGWLEPVMPLLRKMGGR